jgi:hypothetical protein
VVTAAIVLAKGHYRMGAKNVKTAADSGECAAAVGVLKMGTGPQGQSPILIDIRR